MFESVENKPESANYFVDAFKHLEKKSGGLPASTRPHVVTALRTHFFLK